MTLYKIKGEDGIWILETYRQASDPMARKWVGEPVHFKNERSNLLDALKSGDRVMFRVERHKKIGATEIDIFIPHADNPDKEEKFIGDFIPAVAPAVAAHGQYQSHVREWQVDSRAKDATVPARSSNRASAGCPRSSIPAEELC